MTKLNKKLAISISMVVILVSIISLALNNIFIDKYYLHEKKKTINKIGEEIKALNTESAIKSINSLEEKYQISIVYIPVNLKGDSENFITQNLVNEFSKKGISLKKFWISKPKIEDMKEKSINEIYNQGKLKYSILAKFILKDNYIFAVTMPIEHSQETIAIINKFNLILTSFSVIIIVILTFILSKKIINPLEKIKLLSRDIAKLNFRTEKIKTNDEIEELADSVNQMSMSLQNAQNELNKRNENLKIFIGGASHELKTPIALIKAYAMGIQDGIDDGTYLDTIIEQSEKMNDIINNLLYLSKYEKRELKLENVNLKDLIEDTIKEYDVFIESNDIEVNLNIGKDKFIINTDKEGIKLVINNLISNAIKYTTDKKIYIDLNKNEKIYLDIYNKVNPNIEKELEKIWEPFYVLEKSRNKQLSGTGLGLSLVKEILDSHNLKYGIKFNNEYLKFFIEFENN
ncbi:sensor histidine kinase [Paraclostridium sordellii]|uniref:sensor histidine kinase n=1 Tax=Paraclostridium sordellii TaxID=1505 RepID=UPI0005DDDB09|nr:HAMP domain-containing sensor histidine kinase [Paeniclostridium sordellii]CEN82972.1 sensor histidine kinase [[Clostridium] sordellii] [Paeniclostridium sordellii]CEN87964.1 sensor histidine kinase [[Clostridium] sordellii] [Paeniclostridium sordellii]CEQ12118.1 sensor histidine kinase [[Clostridium] sordellii] [Paeniclostridium sordellii]CEQ21983.1 sensor histidine kinase [[Clostridium] sordellii] [Paeniclostridium sordellii]